MILTKKQSIHNIAIYLRLSKDDGDREESESITNQRRIVLEYINENFEYENIYEYVDDGVSGATFNRPGFIKMISELQSNKIELVITKNLARFGRNYLECGDYIEKFFPDRNIRYIAVLDDVDNYEDKISNEFAPIQGVFNELFCRETSRGVKRTKRKKRSSSRYNSHRKERKCMKDITVVIHHHIGYKKDSDNPGKLIIDKEASKIVKRIFDLKLQKKTAKEIADIFNEEKIITPSEYLEVKGLESRTKKIWTRSIIARILCNEVYLGKCCRGKTQNISYKSKKRINIKRNERIVTENTHEAIISLETYNAVHNNNKYENYSKNKNIFYTILSHYMYCAECKKRLRRDNLRKKIRVYCWNSREAEGLCNNTKTYHYEELEDVIFKSIQENFDIFFKKNNVSPSLIKKYNEIKLEANHEEMKKISRKTSEIAFKISKLYNDRLSGNITEEEYKNIYSKFTYEREQLTKDKEFLENEIEEMKNSDENIKKYKKVKSLLKKINKNTLTEEDVSELIDRIEIGNNEIHIFYKFEKMDSSIISCHN